MCVRTTLLVVFLSLALEPAICRVLNDYISHYEPVSYDQSNLMWNHHRLKRSLMGPRHVELSFIAMGRRFDLVLEPERRMFHPDFVMKIDGKPTKKHQAMTYLYSGYDIGTNFRAYGNLAHGVFDGTIETPDGDYHVEPAMRYREHLHDNDTFHSIIYRQSDLNTSSVSTATCGSANQDIHSSMLRLQSSLGRGGNMEHNLRKRQSSRNSNKVRCWLNLILDHKLFLLLDGNNEDPTSVLFGIILRGSSIFEGTDFNSDGNPDGIHFGVREFNIERSPPDPNTFFSQPFIGVSAFLNEHSNDDYSDFCLSYRFTHRDFDGGVVGLAYIAPQPGQNIAGGICQRASGSGTSVRTLNTGIVTSLNYGQRVPPSLSALTFAHEAGHNFGSQHDDGDPPSAGAYIMHAFATDGSQPNNDRFSPGSISMMDSVIATRGQDPSDGCFVEADNLCGNSLVDAGEDCDCGPSDFDSMTGLCNDDPCCMGQNCTLNPSSQCSPGQGPCCTDSCTFVVSNANRMCSPDTDCAFNQTCGGSSAFCPEPLAKPEPDPPGYILCDNEQGLCNGPTCNGTICSILSLETCECTNETQACHVCCLLIDRCTSTFDIALNNLNNLTERLPNGTGRNKAVGAPCNNFTGYCDLLDNCMAVDENGALFRLANLFFNSELLRRFLDFAQDMWWVLVICGVAILVILFLVLLCVHYFLPRPKTVESRRNRSSTIRGKRRPQGHARSGGQVKPVQQGTPYNQTAPPGEYPQNYPQHYGN